LQHFFLNATYTATNFEKQIVSTDLFFPELLLFLVGKERLELSRIAPSAPKAGAFANFATCPQTKAKLTDNIFCSTLVVIII
tara:strand:+ start:1217 stop:1462 length:246 start_codon:yes stop_codon:yes gene_type:complete